MRDTETSGNLPRVLAVVGTRPEAIKMAPVVRALDVREHRVESRLALTGQHDELVDQVLEAFGMSPEYDLGIMKPGQDLYDVAHACLEGLREVIREYRPDLILVQGDTASVFFGSLGAFFEKVGVGHVEAGLRSRHGGMPYPDPFPEEMFRRLTGVLTLHHFAPTLEAGENLMNEGVSRDRVHVTGNTVVDALQGAARVPHDPGNEDLRSALESGRRLVLLTAHRRESFGDPLREAFSAVRELVDEHGEVEVLYPVHPNPQVLEPARELLSGHPRIRLTEPLDYLDLVTALKHAHLVLTDSGGIQEEAPTFGAPVLVLREATERPEGVRAGVARLVGTRKALILAEARAFLTQEAAPRAGPRPQNPYGDGLAGERIADIVVSNLTGSARETADWDGA
jgi:UDP-N-acetylglucosamine 2-epimerase (non-hydrolysing)